MSESSERSGHCATCKTNWYWQSEPFLRDALCPICKQRLMRASPKRYGARINERPIKAVRPKLTVTEAKS